MEQSTELTELECGCDILIHDTSAGLFECSCFCIHELSYDENGDMIIKLLEE